MRSSSPMRLLTLLLFSQWLIAGECYAQNENIITAQKLSRHPFTYANLFNDNESNANNAILQLDSIAQTNATARPFCNVYYNSMKNIEMQIKDLDTGTKTFVQKFEKRFADYFLRACVNQKNRDISASPEWQCFFSNPDAKSWQIILLGVNAHVNVNIWQALVTNFSEEEIHFYKKPMLSIQSSVTKVYDQFFDTLLANNSYLKFINTFTVGFAKKVGERILYKWRRRNVNLAIMYYHNQEKFKRRLAIVNRKKEKIDQRILRYRS